MKKILFFTLALLIVSTNAFAIITPVAADQKAATDDDNRGREHIDIIVRNFQDDRIGTSLSGTNYQIASEGAVVIWATQSAAIIGRDVTFIDKIDSPLVAGIIVESGGIASGAFGRMRIYGYFDDVIAADSTDAVAVGTQLGTSAIVGQVGASAGSGVATVGVCFDAGSGSDGAEIQAMINVCN